MMKNLKQLSTTILLFAILISCPYNCFLRLMGTPSRNRQFIYLLFVCALFVAISCKKADSPAPVVVIPDSIITKPTEYTGCRIVDEIMADGTKIANTFTSDGFIATSKVILPTKVENITEYLITCRYE